MTAKKETTTKHVLVGIAAEIDSDLANNILEAIAAHNRDKDCNEIWLAINSGGGNPLDALAITDTMEWSKIPIYTFGFGLVASAALMIFVAGKKRVLAPHTFVMTHECSTSIVSGEDKLSDTTAHIQQMERVNAEMLAHYKTHTGLTTEQVQEFMLTPVDSWLTAADCKRMGIADAITLKAFKF